MKGNKNLKSFIQETGALSPQKPLSTLGIFSPFAQKQKGIDLWPILGAGRTKKQDSRDGRIGVYIRLKIFSEILTARENTTIPFLRSAFPSDSTSVG